MIDTPTPAEFDRDDCLQALAANPLAAAITDDCGRLQAANDAFTNAFTDLQRSGSPDLISFLHGVSCTDVDFDLSDVLTGASSSVVNLERVDGRHYQILVVPQFTVGLKQWLWEFRDVSSERLLRQHASHEERMGAVVRLAGGMAHEFNNLLTAVLGNLELIRTVPQRSVAEITGHVEAAEGAALRASQLIDELRRFAGRQMSVPRLQTIVPVVEHVTRILQKMATPSVRLATSIDPTVQGVRARISADALSEALMKVGTCALSESSAQGDGDMTVRCRTLPGGQPGVEIRITGVNPSVIGDQPEFVFEPFQASSTSSFSSLSLAVAYSLIAEMSGSMRVVETKDSRAAVEIWLPLVDRIPAHAHDIETPAVSEPCRLHVAVVDNEPGIRSVGQGMLKHLGHQVTCFASGEGLLATITEGASFDLILLDNAMPGLSGRATYARLRSMTEARVLICSGRQVELNSFAPPTLPPPNGVLQKPFSLATLATAIAGQCDDRFPVAQ